MATDILTQLQTCYDQLLTQFFSTVSYLSQRHPLIAPEPVPGDPYTNPPQESVLTVDSSNPATKHRYIFAEPGAEDSSRSAYPLQPVSPQRFQQAQEELAEDLVRKGQQIEFLIARLPGLGRGEEQQAEEIKDLVEKVRTMEELRREKRNELRECVRQLDDIVMGMAKSIDVNSRNEIEAPDYGNLSG